MNKKNLLIDKIIEGIQNKKGKKIAILDLKKISGTLYDYYVICEGNSPSQITAIANSIKEIIKEDLQETPIGMHGYTNAIWIALDYGNVMVHIFQREYRNYYDLDHLFSHITPQYIQDLD